MAWTGRMLIEAERVHRAEGLFQASCTKERRLGEAALGRCGYHGAYYLDFPERRFAHGTGCAGLGEPICRVFE